MAALLACSAAGVHAETVVTGVEGDMLENVLAFLDIDDLSCEASPAEIQGAYQDIGEQASEALSALGYYSPEIRSSIDTSGECWLAEITIAPREPVRLREVDIQLIGPSSPQNDFQTLADRAALTPGSVLDHGRYDALKRNLGNLARDRGYAESRFTESRIDVYPDESVADVVLHLDIGPRYSIGPVMADQDVLDAEFVGAFHELEPGEPFDNRLLTSAFLDLSDSGYFSAVDVRALPPDSESKTIPVQIDLTPAPKRLISYGVGFSTDTGPRLRFGRSVRRVNPRGHQLTFETQLSPVVSELSSTYRLARGDPRSDWLNFGLGAKREETETSLARSIEASVRRVIDRSRGWSRTQYLSVLIEDFEVGSQKGRPHLLIPGVDWDRIRGDDALRPNNGSRLNFEVRGADEAVLSDTSFVQVVAYAKWIRSVSERGRILLRGRAGHTEEENFSHLPPSIRFFAGGDNSVRGFDFESLGPVDADGAVIGGPRLIELSVEYEHAIKPRWSLAFFADSGNAFDETEVDMRTGAGLGARWRSPLGPVRIDVAWPINDVEHGPRLHVSLGPDL